ncbi:MAG: ATP-dependent DNA helicase, partial [Eubacteriales bacterium]|nr:ATP-dependent DNA helicase [Eubacteriales bacterium]
NTIRGVAAESLRSMTDAGALLRGVILSAKEKVCLHSAPLSCAPDLCPYARGFFTRLDDALAELPLQGCMDEAAIGELARRHMLCPHELSLCIAQESDVVICDYNYAFDPRARLRRFFDEGGAYTLLIDEAHNLVDRARDMFSAHIAEKTYADLKKLLPTKGGTPAQRTLRRAILALQKHLRTLRKDMAQDGVTARRYAQLDDEMVQDCLSVLQCLEQMRTAGSAGEYGALFDDAYFPLRTFVDIYAQMDATYGLYGDVSARRLELHIQCLDPDEQLHRAYQSVESVVFFSASMTPFSYYERLLGTRDMAATLDIASAFPQHNLGIYTLGLDTSYRARERTLAELCSALCSFVQARKGNYLFYFPSYAYMRSVCEEFSLRSSAKVLLQRSGMDEAERAAFLAAFDEEYDESLAAFAVMGGIFGEGIDLVGDKLIGVAVIGVGLPQICLARDMMRQYHDDLMEDGFSYAYAVPGFNRVLQAVGRLIRTPTDRGAALLIDKRFERADYARLYPPHWSHIRRVQAGQLSAKLEDFRQNGPAKPPR